jgi:transposase-like protein
MKRKQYTKQKKAEIVLELLKEEKTIAQIAAEYEIHPTQLSQWKKTALDGLPDLFERGEKAAQKAEREQQKQVEQLYKEIGYLTTQVRWLKKKSGIQDD